MTELDLPLLSRFINEILSSQECHICEDEAISLLTKLIDSEEKFFHVEGNTIWRKSNWRITAERMAKQKIESDIFNQKLFARKDALKALREGATRILRIADDKYCLMLCLNILTKKNTQAASMFGVDISNVPELDKPHQIMEGDMYYEL
jgi:hypothetical protein